MLESILLWYNLVYYIPFAIGLLLIIGSALSGAHAIEQDIDGGAPELEAHVDADADGHADHDAEGPGHLNLLAMLGVGKVPLLFLLMTMCLTFGGTGIALNLALKERLASSAFHVALSLVGSTLAMFFTTGLISRTIARLLPSIETDSVSKEGLVGCTGTLILPAHTDTGLAQIRRKGDLYQVQCRCQNLLPKGTPILLTEFDPEQDAYFVCPDPTKDER